MLINARAEKKKIKSRHGAVILVAIGAHARARAHTPPLCALYTIYIFLYFQKSAL